MYSFYYTLKWGDKKRIIRGKPDIKANYQLNQSKPQKTKATPEDKKATANKPAKAKRSVLLHAQDALAASAWLRQDDRTDSNRRTSATAVPAAASILPGCHEFAINSLQMYRVCLTAFQRKASGCVLHGTRLSLIPSDVWWWHWARDWQTLMGALPALLMYVRFSASPACSACRSVQLRAVKWPTAKSYRKEKKHSYSIS